MPQAVPTSADAHGRALAEVVLAAVTEPSAHVSGGPACSMLRADPECRAQADSLAVCPDEGCIHPQEGGGVGRLGAGVQAPFGQEVSTVGPAEAVERKLLSGVGWRDNRQHVRS